VVSNDSACMNIFTTIGSDLCWLFQVHVCILYSHVAFQNSNSLCNILLLIPSFFEIATKRLFFERKFEWPRANIFFWSKTRDRETLPKFNTAKRKMATKLDQRSSGQRSVIRIKLCSDTKCGKPS
jgi:hypothetical protein